MKINTVQSILLRQLRQLNEQHRTSGSGSTRSNSGGASSMASPMQTQPKPFSKIRRRWNALNDWLAAYYRAYGMTNHE